MRLDPIAFTIAFAVGLCLMLCFVPGPRVVIRFPRPDAATDIARDGKCYRIRPEEVSCSSGIVKYEDEEQPGPAESAAPRTSEFAPFGIAW